MGRQIFYAIAYNGHCYGHIGFGSATRFLPNRPDLPLERGINNIFYHIEKKDGKYPLRNFTTKALLVAESWAIDDWKYNYHTEPLWFETLVELPRKGDLYKKAGYSLIGQTKGYTCKRVAGKGTDSWSGKRVWDMENLRPKLVFYKRISNNTELS